MESGTDSTFSFSQKQTSSSSLQWQSASKAINSTEAPAKEKHVRSKKPFHAEMGITTRFDLDLILGTFRLEGARLFWSMMTRLQLESHPIVCWKFCYVIHRLLRDGHKHVSYSYYFHRLSIFSTPGGQWFGFPGTVLRSAGQVLGKYDRLSLTRNLSKRISTLKSPLSEHQMSAGSQTVCTTDFHRSLTHSICPDCPLMNLTRRAFL